MPRTRTLLALVLLPLLVFLVACGGDDDDGGNGGDSQPAASDSSGSSGSSGSSDSSSSNSDSSGDASDDNDGDADGAEILANCPELLGMFGAFSSGAFANPGAGSNLNDDLENVAAVWQNAAANAPDEIKADMQVMADAFVRFFDGLNDLGVDFSNPATFAALDANQQAELQALLETFDDPALEQASNNLDAWFSENCE